MLHSRIIGFGWILLGAIATSVPLMYLMSDAPWHYVLRHGFAGTLDAAELVETDLIGLAFCLAIVFVGYGVLFWRWWARVSCIVLAILLMFLAVREFFRHKVIGAELVYVWAVILLSVYSVIYLVFFARKSRL